MIQSDHLHAPTESIPAPSLRPMANAMANAITNAVSAVIGAGAGYFFGGLDGFLYALALLAVIDYVTGTASAAIRKTLSSAAGLRGVLRKSMMFILVGVAHTLDAYVLGGGAAPIRNAVIFFFISNEGLSILENAASAGLPIPPELKNLLAKRRNAEEGTP